MARTMTCLPGEIEDAKVLKTAWVSWSEHQIGLLSAVFSVVSRRQEYQTVVTARPSAASIFPLVPPSIPPHRWRHGLGKPMGVMQPGRGDGGNQTGREGFPSLNLVPDAAIAPKCDHPFLVGRVDTHQVQFCEHLVLCQPQRLEVLPTLIPGGK